MTEPSLLGFGPLDFGFVSDFGIRYSDLPMSEKRIEPRTLRGFRDYLPKLMLPRERMLEQARRVYRSYGFAPIATPALEYTEILLGKGGAESDKLIYRFQDHGGRDVA